MTIGAGLLCTQAWRISAGSRSGISSAMELLPLHLVPPTNTASRGQLTTGLGRGRELCTIARAASSRKAFLGIAPSIMGSGAEEGSVDEGQEHVSRDATRNLLKRRASPQAGRLLSLTQERSTATSPRGQSRNMINDRRYPGYRVDLVEAHPIASGGRNRVG